MQSKKDTQDKYLKRKLVQIVIYLIIILALILFIVFAWFVSNKSVHQTGMDSAASDVPQIKISDISGGDDISFTAGEAEGQRRFDMPIDNDQSTISPGKSGSFDMYITIYGTTSSKCSLTITPDVLAGGENGSGTSFSPFRTEMVDGTAVQYVSNEQAAKAVKFMKGHILLFLSCNDGVYSDWLDTYSGTDLTLDCNIENKKTVYWVWVDSYKKFQAGSSLIAAQDLTKIQNYYISNGTFTDNAKEFWFDTRTNVNITPSTDIIRLLHYYDFGDEDIGQAVYYNFFRMSFANVKPVA